MFPSDSSLSHSGVLSKLSLFGINPFFRQRALLARSRGLEQENGFVDKQADKANTKITRILPWKCNNCNVTKVATEMHRNKIDVTQ